MTVNHLVVAGAWAPEASERLDQPQSAGAQLDTVRKVLSDQSSHPVATA